MKKYITTFLFIVFLFSVLQITARDGNKRTNRLETSEKRDSTQNVKIDLAKKQDPEFMFDAQVVKQRKAEIEAKERSIDKNKKVKRFGFDENLPQIIRKRNIP